MKKHFFKFTIGMAAVSLLATISIPSVSMASGPGAHGFDPGPVLHGAGPWQVNNNTQTIARACPDSSSTGASCNALVLAADTINGQSPFGSILNYGITVVNGLGNGHGHGAPNDTFANNPNALSPAQIITAYNFPTTNSTGGLPGTGKTIAIVDAYDDPNIASDLATFDSQFGIPQLASCTITPTSGPCLQKVNQTGGTSYPVYNSNWAMEISLDVEWAHAIAPGASILLVEATTNNWTDLLKSVMYANPHTQFVSMSWGGSEFSGEKNYDGAFSSSTVSYFAAAGDAGLPPIYPSTSPKVISVGGTSLQLTTSGAVASETGWASGGGGCSAFESATAAQVAYPTYAQVSCAGKRATPDVAANADPNSGGFVYNSNDFSGLNGWFTIGGTSLSTPIWAARAANAGVVVNSAYIYGANNIKFNDITQGGNAAGCLVGYDMCSGLGSWNN